MNTAEEVLIWIGYLTSYHGDYPEKVLGVLAQQAEQIAAAMRHYEECQKPGDNIPENTASVSHSLNVGERIRANQRLYLEFMRCEADEKARQKKIKEMSSFCLQYDGEPPEVKWYKRLKAALKGYTPHELRQ